MRQRRRRIKLVECPMQFITGFLVTISILGWWETYVFYLFSLAKLRNRQLKVVGIKRNSVWKTN